MQRKITIIGTGYAGLTAGICLGFLGHKVVCVDNDKSKRINASTKPYRWSKHL